MLMIASKKMAMKLAIPITVRKFVQGKIARKLNIGTAGLTVDCLDRSATCHSPQMD